MINDYVYFCASKKGQKCDFYRTQDIVNGPYEKIEGTFDFWDPNLFQDDDGRIFLYWGSSNVTPVWGVELDPENLKPAGSRQALIRADAQTKGYERLGEDHSVLPLEGEKLEQVFRDFLETRGIKESEIPSDTAGMLRAMLGNQPYIEGAWMTKYNGKYYLQYACPGTEYNIYADGVYLSDFPLGPFVLAGNNPFSYKPGGFSYRGRTWVDNAG